MERRARVHLDGAGRGACARPADRRHARGLDAVLEGAGARRRYAVGGNVAFIAWTEPIDRLSTTLETIGLTGQVLTGPAGRRLIGTVRPSEFERRVRMVMDPDGRFGGDA